MEKLRSLALSIPITLESWLISFAGIVLLRTFLEQFAYFQSGHFALIDLPTIVHYGAFYLATIVALMVILMSLGKVSIQEVSVVCIFGFFVICIAPIVDLVTGGIGGHQISYLFISGKELLLQFATFFGHLTTTGITLGIRIETVLGIIFCYLYVHTATKNIVRAIAAAVLFYCLIFFLVSVPSIAALFLNNQMAPALTVAQSVFSSHIIPNSIHPNFTANGLSLLELGFNKMMTGINAFVALFFTGLFFYFGARKKFTAIIKNCRPERIFHFFLLFAFGSSLIFTAWPASWIDIQSYITAFLGLTCAWMYSVCQNDIYDKAIDLVSNRSRPLIAGELSKNDMETASGIFLLFTFMFAYASGSYVLLFTTLFVLVYYAYSNPPLRLKRFVIVNSFLVSLACLSVIMTGFFMLSPNKSTATIPEVFLCRPLCRPRRL